MGALATNSQMSRSINGKGFVGMDGYLANVGNNYADHSPNGATSQESLSSSSSTPNESPCSEHRYRQAISARDSLSTAKALGSGPRQDEDDLDMICIGFGPASLAIAIALADAYSKSSRPLPKVLFIEKQEEFSWHSGMQLPSAKMQISFLKDLATPRDPTSPYSFINYLHSKDRLNQFINLGTFLPTRLEYEDYMRWCADHFEGVVKYGAEVISVEPDTLDPKTEKARSFRVKWKDSYGIESGLVSARHVVVAAGGEPYVPKEFKSFTALLWNRVSHSSRYSKTAAVLGNRYRKPTFLRQQREAKEEELVQIKGRIEEEKLFSQKQLSRVEPIALAWTKNRFPRQLQNEKRISKLEQELAEARAEEEKCNLSVRQFSFGLPRPRFVVIGNGQSAAEIFSDLWTRFPSSEISLIIKGAALRPSDDSPFVNEIFDPERVDDIYQQAPEERKQAIARDKGTNYGVVRLELLEHIYEQIYMQRLREPDPSRWRCKIISNRKVTKVRLSEEATSLLLQLTPTREGAGDIGHEELTCEHVFVATGYTRNAYQEILKDTRLLLPDGHHGESFPVGRDYGVQFDSEKVEKGAGVWLQGCNESTHGLSDTLLSILAVRGGEVVESIFGDDLAKSHE